MTEGMIDAGLSGWFADHGENMPIISSPSSISEHCNMPLIWAKINSELIDESNNRSKLFVFHQSSAVGSCCYASAFCTGNHLPKLSGQNSLSSAINALLTGGISGMAINHSHIGGVPTKMSFFKTAIRTKEEVIRWMEFAAFTPTFRTSETYVGSGKNCSIYADIDVYMLFAQLSLVHRELLWYFKSLETQAVAMGMPMLRALWLEYPEDPTCCNIRSQFMLGGDILVCPALTEGSDNIHIYLPDENWIYPYTGEVIEGGRHLDVTAPVGKPMVLIRAGSAYAGRLLSAFAPLCEQ